MTLLCFIRQYKKGKRLAYHGRIDSSKENYFSKNIRAHKLNCIKQKRSSGNQKIVDTYKSPSFGFRPTRECDKIYSLKVCFLFEQN